VKQKPLLNKKETRTLLNTFKITIVTGMLSLTVAGWSLLARADMRQTLQSGSLLPGTKQVIAAQPTPTSTPHTATASTPATASQVVTRLNVVQWTRDTAGDRVAIVMDNQGRLWYVMGSDVPRIEKGLQPQFRPQPVRVTTHSRAS
jgi:hypothetical protein